MMSRLSKIIFELLNLMSICPKRFQIAENIVKTGAKWSENDDKTTENNVKPT